MVRENVEKGKATSVYSGSDSYEERIAKGTIRSLFRHRRLADVTNLLLSFLNGTRLQILQSGSIQTQY